MWLKEKLEQQDYRELDLLLSEMLSNIGNTDPYIRDHLIYNAFEEIISNNYLTDYQFIDLFDQLLIDKRFTYKIGDVEDNSVFTRSFSALVLALILQEDRDKKILQKRSFIRLLETTIFYLVNENDKRGYVLVNGWAHSIAHCSDLMNEIILHPLFEETSYEEILDAIFSVVNVSYVYQDDEIERISIPTASLINQYPNNLIFTENLAH